MTEDRAIAVDLTGSGIERTVKVTQEIELSLTEVQIPPVVHAKQHDRRWRQIRCVMYNGASEYPIPENAIVAVSGMRPDGMVFQYSSDTAPDEVFLDGGTAIVTITEFMTAKFGRYPVDVTLLDGNGGVLGSFSFTLKVDKAAVGNGKIATITYEGMVTAILDGLVEVYLTENGELAIRTNDGLGIHEGYYSSAAQAVEQRMNSVSLDQDGRLCLETDSKLCMKFRMDGEGKLFARIERR